MPIIKILYFFIKCCQYSINVLGSHNIFAKKYKIDNYFGTACLFPSLGRDWKKKS